MNKEYLYNNEAIAALALLSVMRHCEAIQLSSALLISPLLLHSPTLKRISLSSFKIRSIEEFIVKYPECFANFQERYKSLLAISINSVAIAIEMKKIEVKNGYLIKSKEFDTISFNIPLGIRAKSIIRSSEKIAIIFSEKSSNLHLHLRLPV